MVNKVLILHSQPFVSLLCQESFFRGNASHFCFVVVLLMNGRLIPRNHTKMREETETQHAKVTEAKLTLVQPRSQLRNEAEAEQLRHI